jgi:putative membrane protein PagO
MLSSRAVLASKLILVVLYVVVCLIWGTTWIGIKMAVESIPPLTAAGLRFIVAFPFFLVMTKLFNVPIAYPKGKFGLLVFVTLIYFAAPYFMMNYGESFVSSGLAAILFSSVSVLMILFSMFFLSVRIAPLQWVGIAIGIVGLALLIIERGGSFASHDWLATGAILGAAVCHALSYVIIKKHGDGINVFTLNCLPIGMSGALLLGLGLVFESPNFATMTASSLWAIFYLSIVASVIGLAVYFYLLQKLGPTRLSYVFIFFPVIALGLSALLENEPLSGRFLAIFACMLAGFGLTKLHPNALARQKLKHVKTTQ